MKNLKKEQQKEKKKQQKESPEVKARGNAGRASLPVVPARFRNVKG